MRTKQTIEVNINTHTSIYPEDSSVLKKLLEDNRVIYQDCALKLNKLGLRAILFGSAAILEAYEQQKPSWVLNSKFINQDSDLNIYANYPSNRMRLLEIGFKKTGTGEQRWHANPGQYSGRKLTLYFPSSRLKRPEDLAEVRLGCFTISLIGVNSEGKLVATQQALDDFQSGTLRLLDDMPFNSLSLLLAFKYKAYGFQFDKTLQIAISTWIKSGDISPILYENLSDWLTTRTHDFTQEFAKLLWEEKGLLLKIYNRRFKTPAALIDYVCSKKFGDTKKKAYLQPDNDARKLDNINSSISPLAFENTASTPQKENIIIPQIPLSLPPKEIEAQSLPVLMSQDEPILNRLLKKNEDIFIKYASQLRELDIQSIYVGSSAMLRAYEELKLNAWKLNSEFILSSDVDLLVNNLINKAALNTIGFAQSGNYERTMYLDRNQHPGVEMQIYAPEGIKRSGPMAILQARYGCFTISKLGFSLSKYGSDPKLKLIYTPSALADLKSGILKLEEGFSLEENSMILLFAFKYRAYGLKFDPGLQNAISQWIKTGEVNDNLKSLFYKKLFNCLMVRGEGFRQEYARLLFNQDGLLEKLYGKSFSSPQMLLTYLELSRGRRGNEGLSYPKGKEEQQSSFPPQISNLPQTMSSENRSQVSPSVTYKNPITHYGFFSLEELEEAVPVPRRKQGFFPSKSEKQPAQLYQPVDLQRIRKD